MTNPETEAVGGERTDPHARLKALSDAVPPGTLLTHKPEREAYDALIVASVRIARWLVGEESGADIKYIVWQAVSSPATGSVVWTPATYARAQEQADYLVESLRNLICSKGLGDE